MAGTILGSFGALARLSCAPLFGIACATLSLNFLAFASPVLAEEKPRTPGPEALTLGQAVEIALGTNPLLRATASGQELAVAQLREAQAGWLPTLQVGETVTRSNNAVFVFGSLLEQRQFSAADFSLNRLNDPAAYTNWRSYANLQVPIFNQLQTVAKVEQSRLGVRQAQAQQDYTAQHLRFEVIRAYYGVLVQEANKEVADESVRSAEAELKRMKDRFQTGAVVESELLAMQVQLADFRQRQIQAGGNVAVAYAALCSAMGIPIGSPVRLASTAMERSFTVADQGQLMEAALSSRPDFRHAQMDVEVKHQGTRAAKGQYLPQLNLFASVGNSAENLGTSGSDYAFGANLSINLFDGGRYPRLRQAQAAEIMAHARQDHLADQVRLEVVQVREQFLAAQERLKVASESVQQADEALRMVRDRYNGGLTTITEVLRSQTAQLQAKTSLLGARYDYFVGYANVLLATGGLNDVHAFTDRGSASAPLIERGDR
jgi:outer membrane protein TolC